MSYLQAAAPAVDMLAQMSPCLSATVLAEDDPRQTDPSSAVPPLSVLASWYSHILSPGPSKIAAGRLSSPVH